MLIILTMHNFALYCNLPNIANDKEWMKVIPKQLSRNPSHIVYNSCTWVLYVGFTQGEKWMYKNYIKVARESFLTRGYIKKEVEFVSFSPLLSSCMELKWALIRFGLVGTTLSSMVTTVWFSTVYLFVCRRGESSLLLLGLFILGL
jgi:hypothetical protein